MRIISYTSGTAEVQIQRGSIIDELEIRDIEYTPILDRNREPFIDLWQYEAFLYNHEQDCFIPTTLTESELYDFKRELMEYLDFDTDSELFDGGDRDGSCC